MSCRQQSYVFSIGETFNERKVEAFISKAGRLVLDLKNVLVEIVWFVSDGEIVACENAAKSFGLAPRHWKIAELLGELQGLCFGLDLPCLSAAVVIGDFGMPSDVRDGAYVHWRRRFVFTADLPNRGNLMLREQSDAFDFPDRGHFPSVARVPYGMIDGDMSKGEAVVTPKQGAGILEQFVEVAAKSILAHTRALSGPSRCGRSRGCVHGLLYG